MKDKKPIKSISFLIQDNQGYSTLYYQKFDQDVVSLHNIFDSLNKIVNNLRLKKIIPISIEIYSGEIIQEDLLFQMIYQDSGNQSHEFSSNLYSSDGI
ncbi:MAG: hypothetical protein HeimC3_36820 [Candidatus Heimdallarchaeota archaeon LC_3]|nr:MAG: hypothetical protein HeimC3_36820 [Candidatus Heimdallarchaeota archaeon LC_3]